MTKTSELMPGLEAATFVLRAFHYPHQTVEEARSAAVSALVAADPYHRAELLADLADELADMGFSEAAHVLDLGSFDLQAVFPAAKALMLNEEAGGQHG